MSTNLAQHTVYRAQALDATRQQIRLIQLEKNTSSKHQPRCTIQAFDLASAPKYIALSYTWGPPDPSYRILIDNQTFKVRENLYNFLCTFQTGSAIRTDVTYMYVDQICIDQENLQERNSQVRLMSDIYTGASLVLVWLGNDPKDVKAAHDFEDNDIESADGEYGLPLGNLKIVLSNAYFERVWIVQEVSLASEIRILIGDYTVTWGAIEFAGQSFDPLKPVNRAGTLKELFREKDRKKEWQLDKIVGRYSVHECQDPRDKVYGFLGMVPDWQRPVVDYAKSPRQVFLDVIPIVLTTYWKNKPTEVIYNVRLRNHLRSYLENMLKLAWNMGLPDHDLDGLTTLFQEIIYIEDCVTRNSDDLMDVIDGFGYETVSSDVGSVSHGTLMGRWWVSFLGQKDYHECRTMIGRLDKSFIWTSLENI